MSKYKYGAELYPFKKEMDQDLTGTLKQVKAMGYQGVEFAQDLSRPASEIRKALDDAGLTCCGWHTAWSLVQDDKLDSTVAYFKTVGNKNVIVPGLPEEYTLNKEAYLLAAAFLNRLEEKLAPRGMRVGYHNHDGELPFFPGTAECPFTVLFDNTKPAVMVQMDNGHVINGRGFGILSLLRRYPNRYKTVHLKPYSLEKGALDRENGYNSMIGQDDVPWMEFMRICRTTGGTEWFIVEYESASMYPGLSGIGECMKALTAMEERGEI